jgi:predicted metal-binding membrane protein
MTTIAFPQQKGVFATRAALPFGVVIVAGWIAALVLAPAPMAAMAPPMGIALWVAMVAATMLPSALPVARHVAVNSLRRRRARAVLLFAGGYLAVWTAFGAVALAVLPRSGSRTALALALLAAAGWQLTPWHRRALRGCHRTMPLPAVGWRADAAAMRFGLGNGGYCLGASWLLMVVMCCAPGPPMLWAAAIGAGVFVQKTTEIPAHVARVAAVALLVVALFAAI